MESICIKKSFLRTGLHCLSNMTTCSVGACHTKLFIVCLIDQVLSAFAYVSLCSYDNSFVILSPVSLSPGFTLQFQSQCADEASIRCWGVMLSASVWDPSISTLIELSLRCGMQDHYAWSSLITWPECACQRANLAVSEAGVGQAFGAGVSREDFLEPKRHLEEWVGFRGR